MSKVLVVDDSAFARMVVRRSLEHTGRWSTIEEAEDGESALEQLRSGGFALVVADLNMPRLDGVALLRRIKCSPALHHITVVIVSSLVNPEREAQLQRAGAAAVLAKPVHPRSLADILSRVEEAA